MTDAGSDSTTRDTHSHKNEHGEEEDAVLVQLRALYARWDGLDITRAAAAAFDVAQKLHSDPTGRLQAERVAYDHGVQAGATLMRRMILSDLLRLLEREP